MEMEMEMEMEERAISSVKGDQDLQVMSPNDPSSELPEEILVDIMSQVKMKEMVQTSVFSKRWRHVWRAMRNLNFDASETLHDFTKSVELERPIYVRFVNEVIRHHEARNIDQFAVVFSLDETCSRDIDSWIGFALRKGVRNLKLDLSNEYHSEIRFYTFPHSIETSSCGSLTSLQLFGVNISGDVLELLLSNCPNLEFVSVSGSKTLVSLNVDGPQSLKLKWLELYCCLDLVALNLSAPNLVSFKYFGQIISMELKYVPKLSELSIQGHFAQEIQYTLPGEFSSFVSQLETLTYEACADEKTMKWAVFPEFTKLKHLKLIFIRPRGYCLLWYKALIKASPSLYKITVQMSRTYKPDTSQHLLVEKCPHNIKVVEFDGFQGCVTDTEFAEYLIENAIALERIVFDTRVPKRDRMWYKYYDETGDRDRAFARQRAEQLGERLPAGVELVII